MKKRVIALALSIVMLATCLGAGMLAPTPVTLVDENGAEATSAVVPQLGRKTLTASYADATETTGYQWQFSNDGDTWIDIYGETAQTCSLSYAKVKNMLDADGQAQLRCVVTDGEDERISSAATVTVDYSAQTAEAAAEAQPGVSLKAAPARAASYSMPAATQNADTPSTYNVVINYLFENNAVAADPYTANLAAGSSFSATVTFPTVQGYLPYVNETQQNSIDLNFTAIDKDYTYNVVYKPTNVNYTVIHYKQNLDDDKYTEAARETKQGLTNSIVPEVANTYAGFYALLYEKPNIAADGSTVVEIYYDRYYYLMNFDLDGGYGVEPIYARYGTPIGDVGTPTKAGYTFAGWDKTIPETMPAENSTYKAVWTPGTAAKVTVVFWGENADDEEYSYIKSQQIYVKPGKEFTYNESGSLICGLEEHTHSIDDNCYSLTCTKEVHTHSERCYTCVQESHTHDTSCYAGVGSAGSPLLAPDNPSNGQIYRGWAPFVGSWSYIYINGVWYNYSGNLSDGKIATPTCGKTEGIHTHTDACLGCGKTEHTHSIENGCYTLTCGKTEHTHKSSCYMSGAGLDSNLWKFVKSDTITVAADGSSVVNVYYDRTTFTLRFLKSSSAVKTISKKWGADIHENFPIMDGTYTMWWNVPSGCKSFKPGTQLGSIDTMPAENVDFTYYDKKNSSTIYYYVETIDGATGSYTTDDGKQFDLYKTIKCQSGGSLTYTEEFHDIIGFKQYWSDPIFNKMEQGGTAGIKSVNYLCYTRNNFGIVYYNPTKLLKTDASVPYDKNLASYYWEPTSDMAPDKYEPGSVEFEGWYLNPECSGQKFDFSSHTMPAGPTNTNGEVALSLYAKWVPVTHKVEFYMDKDALENGTKLSTHPDITVPHGSKADPTPAEPTKGSYTFVGWFYMENGVEKAFDFANMPVTKDMKVYGKWSSNVLKQYTIYYKIQGTDTEIAAPTTGSGLAGVTKTFEAKGGTDLYADYQEGYFPATKSHSLTLDIENDANNVYTFWYVQKEAVPYTVKYLNKKTGEPLAGVPEKIVSDNRKAVVTETFVPVSGMMPDAYQKRLVVSAQEGAVNEIIFYYTEDTTHAYYKITHYTENLAKDSQGNTTWTEYASSQAVGDIGKTYKADPMTIPGFTYDSTVAGTVVSGKLTAEGLELNLYYTRNSYPYQVRYLEQGTGKQLADPKDGTGKYGQVISESAIDIANYTAVAPTSQTLNIRIEESSTEAKLNIITFYYTENVATINYVVVGPDGATDFGSVNPTSETVKVLSGTAKGSTAEAKTPTFRFVGWYSDADCTQPVDSSWVDKYNKLTPVKADDAAWTDTTYYAKFEYNHTDLTITKNATPYDANDMFIFTVKDSNGKEVAKVALKDGESVTIKNLTVGETYTVTEDTSWSWRYKDQNPQKITLTADPTQNVVTVKNEIENNNWLGASSYAINQCVQTIKSAIDNFVKDLFN